MNLDRDKSWFLFVPIIPNIVIITIAVGIYYLIATNNLFVDWLNVIFWIVKIIIAFEIITGSARSLLAPILAFISGLLLMYILQVYNMDFISISDAKQLLAMSGVGFVITLLVRLA